MFTCLVLDRLIEKQLLSTLGVLEVRVLDGFGFNSVSGPSDTPEHKEANFSLFICIFNLIDHLVSQKWDPIVHASMVSL